MREEKILRVYKQWEELSEDQKKEIHTKELDNELYTSMYQDLKMQVYNFDLKTLQKKHDLMLEPIYTQGSQHDLLGFKSIEDKYDNQSITYKDQEFYMISYLSGIKRFDFDIEFGYHDIQNETMILYAKQLRQKIEDFVKDFLKMYEEFEEFFMYGSDKNYEYFVLDMCEDQEYLIEEMVV
jgi:hypothetical protein